LNAARNKAVDGKVGAVGPWQRRLGTHVCWYLVRTKPGREKIAEFNLQRQNYLVYHPRLLRPARQRGNWIEKVVSLFPGYIFLHLAQAQGLGPVRSTIGVNSIVRFGHSYAVVPDRIIEDLRARADTETGLHRLRRLAQLRAGSSVRIVAGVFDSLEGIFQRESGAERVVLLIGLLGCETQVEVSSAFVLPQFGSPSKLAAQ
jgi:transcriptional antiterminator RfaH